MQEKCPLLCRTARVRVTLRPHSFQQILSDCNLKARASQRTKPKRYELLSEFEDFEKNVRSSNPKIGKLRNAHHDELGFRAILLISNAYERPNSNSLLVILTRVLFLLLSSAALIAAKLTCFGSA